jgi:hypothetical protein
MVEWLAGNRLRGTSAERTTTTGFNTVSAASGGWVELGRSTASGGETSLSVSSLADKRYYQVITSDHGIAGAPARLWRFNNDSGSNYARRVSSNGAADGTTTSQTSHNELSLNDTSQNLSIHYIANYSTKEKLQITHAVGGNSSAASVAPARVEFVGKWANTSDAIDRIDYIANSGSFSSGDEVVVLGWDDSDTHTTNFWEELASVELSCAANSLSTGTFTAKKYLWVQFHIPSSSAANNYNMRVGNATIDTGSNYSFRYNTNGAADGTAVTQDTIKTSWNGASGSEWAFTNMFIINNSANEKLFISHTNRNYTAGAGAAPDRHEVVGKWANTSSQINIIDIYHQTGAATLGAGTIMKVWGSD